MRMSGLTAERLREFPGWNLIREGLDDIGAGRLTPAACLVWIGWPRLEAAGVVPAALAARRMAEPERALYRLLQRDGDEGYGRYNALLRRLARFEHALDHALFHHAP